MACGIELALGLGTLECCPSGLPFPASFQTQKSPSRLGGIGLWAEERLECYPQTQGELPGEG